MSAARFLSWLSLAALCVTSCSTTPQSNDTARTTSTPVAAVTPDPALTSSSTVPGAAPLGSESTPSTTITPEVSTVQLGSALPTTPSRCGSPAASSVITLWHIFGGDQANLTFQTLVDQFNSTHPGTRLVATKFNGLQDLRQTLDETQPEDWPDIVVTAPSALIALVDSGLVIPPSACAPTNGADLLPVVRATYTVNGALQAEPYGVSTPVLLFDATEARRAGLDPADPPRTLDELRAASKRVVESGVSPHGLVVADVDGEFLIYQGAAQRGELVASSNNGRTPGVPEVDLSTPDIRAAMSWLHDVVENDGGVWIGSSAGSDDLAKVIDPTDGGTFAIHTSASIGDILAAIDAGSFPGVELGVGPMPGPGPGGTVGGNALFLVDHGSPARAGAAWSAIDWLTQPSQMAVFDAATGYIPRNNAVRSTSLIQAAYAAHPQLEVGYEQLAASAGTSAGAGPSFGPGPEIDSILGDLTTKAVLDQQPIDTALSNATTAVNRALETYADLNG